ncbi:MAG: hypothetical protein ACF8XB_16280 [Planctomycetota bacterium JB042]
MRIALLAPLAVSLLAAPLAGQAVRSTATVTPEGIFVTEQSDLAAPKAGPTFASGTNPNPSAAGLRWTLPNPAGMPWISMRVATGNHGTFHWLGQDLNFRRVQLVASTDDQAPALPIYEDPYPAATLAKVEIEAADEAPTAVGVWFDTINSQSQVRLYSGFSATPTPFAGPVVREHDISDDGAVIALGFTDTNGNAAAAIVDQSFAPISTAVAPTGPFVQLDLSDDGSTLLMASATTNYVFDVATGNLVYQDSSTVFHQAHVISGDGDTWGRGGFDVGLWKKIGGAYQRILTYDDTSFISSSGYTAAGLSEDGSTFVVAAVDAANWLDFRVYCWSVGATSTTLLWRYVHVSAGTFQDTPQQVELSADGKTIAVASWGAQVNGHPEVLIFDRDVGIVPVGSIDTPGSAMDVDVSEDGQFVVAGTKAVHANTNGNGGEAYSFDLGGQGYRLRGTPSIGRSIQLEIGGNPGDPVLLWAGLSLLPSPVPVFPFRGTFALDPAFLFLLPTPVGTIPGSGVATLPVTIPFDPATVGATVYTQVARTTGGGTIDNFLRLPITP